jgi:MSHA biogenesis protein MshL
MMKRPCSTTFDRRAFALASLAGAALLGGCAQRPLADDDDALPKLRAEAAAPTPVAPATVAAPAAAPPVAAAPAEPRFDLIVNNANAREVFLSMVTDTRYSMLMHPQVTGTLSVTLRGVTVREALESIRDVYGYDFRIDGRRITVYPPTLQTRIFSVNYLHTRRAGRSEVRVSAGSAPVHNSSAGQGTAGGTGSPDGVGGPTLVRPESSHVATTSASDYWSELGAVLRAIVGEGNGRSVVTSPQSGTIAVRGMPDELRQVDAFLRASGTAIERQVMLEAKIVEVELREGFESGVDWSVLRARGAAGQTSGYPFNPLIGNGQGLPTLPAPTKELRIDAMTLPVGSAGTLGLSLATRGFTAVLGFLETQGDVQILSSPRVATLNNQKAVLKVGTDDYYVTGVQGGTNTTNTNTNDKTFSMPTVMLTPFFSGIALDVTPQIDDTGMITLHVHPSVSAVTEKTKEVDLGVMGRYQLPVASSSVNETDTIVRVPDGQIVAIGGLMQQESRRSTSGLPGAAGNVLTRHLFGNNASSGRKKELVVLIRPTILHNADDWQRTTAQASAGLEEIDEGRRRVIRLDGGRGDARAAASSGVAVVEPSEESAAGR